PQNASVQEKSATEDLQVYLYKISGARPETLHEGITHGKIPIYIGHTNAAMNSGLANRVKQLKDDGFIIKITSEAAYIIGKNPLATRFAVIGLLEDHLGVRWYISGELGEFVPHAKNVTLKEGEYIQEPSFPMRWVGYGGWSLRNRMNVGVDNKLGLHVYGAAHTFCKLVPVDKYFDTHPEYFALIDGKRKRYDGDPCFFNQLETANPDAIKLISENASTVLKENPEIDVMTIYPNDGTNFSESKESKAFDDPNEEMTVEDINKHWDLLGKEKYGVLSRRMTLFYIEVAKSILSKHPDKYVQVGAYQAYRNPPKNLNIKAPENTIVEYSHYDCHDRPIEAGSCNASYSQDIDGWKTIYPLFSIYEYYWKLAALELPYPIVHSIRKDIPYFYKKGGFGLVTQYSEKNVGTLLLNYYVAAKLLWNVNADVDKILDDFYRTFYGPAWASMKAYYETLEKAVIESNLHLPAEYNEITLIFTSKVLADCERYLNQALDVAKGNSVISARINIARVSFGYVKLVIDYVHSLEQKVPESGWSSYYKNISSELQESKNIADKIFSYLEENKSSNCFHTPITSYIKDFLNPAYAIKNIACYGDRIRFDKEKWVKEKKYTTGKKGLSHSMLFDLWIYGYAYKLDKKHAEQEVYLIDVNGEKVKIGKLVTLKTGKNHCYVIRGIDSGKFVHNKDTLELHIVNPRGEWMESFIYAIYIMPHDSSMTSDKVAYLVEQAIDKLREQSFSFMEFCYFGGLRTIDGQSSKLLFKIYSS
ncbi:MAG: DUF4838 domain-containing protein, partial [Nitrospira sp.]|nr:DUF4838 domain-containing protein [Nitrospira sp.]